MCLDVELVAVNSNRSISGSGRRETSSSVHTYSLACLLYKTLLVLYLPVCIVCNLCKIFFGHGDKEREGNSVYCRNCLLCDISKIV